jgi:hypothetical protein
MLAPRCPQARPATAQTLITVSTCGFGETETTCVPLRGPGCPYRERVALFYLLVDPGRPGSICTADVHVFIEATTAGGVRLLWEAQELEDADIGCRGIGPEYEGEATVEGPCCERSVDIPLPHARRTFRIVVRTDWQ